MPATQARVERVFPFVLEERSDGEVAPRIVGHAAVFNALSENLGGFREEIRRGAFAKTIAEADVRGLFNHDPNFVLGRNKAGTLGLSEDGKGLRIAAEPPDTTWARDLQVSMKRGDIDQMSFAFSVVKEAPKLREQSAEERLASGDDLPVRTIHEVRLYDVSVVTFPAYTQTDAAVRSALLTVGIDHDALAATVARHERGISLSTADVDLIRGSIAALSALLPAEPIALRTEDVTPPADEPTPPVVSLALRRKQLELVELAVLTA